MENSVFEFTIISNTLYTVSLYNYMNIIPEIV